MRKKKLKASKAWLRDNMHKRVSQTMKKVQLALVGHCSYYGVSRNFRQIQNFWKYVRYSCFRI